ncbi:MAG: C10 family peptidase [Bacteroidales bacterium]|nr:C10 family peptidase [Bacteroidales bacterium]
MKKPVLTLLCALFLLPLFAENVPAGIIAQLGTNAYQQRCPAGTEVTLKNIDFLTQDGDTLMALLHFQNGGFLLMSTEDAAIPILGYSTTDDLPLDNIAPATQQWIDAYGSQILQIRQKGLAATEEITEMWRSLDNSTKGLRTTVVPALVTAKWNQSQYYNDLCPADSDAPYGYGGHVPCGCVALAMAMVIHYYRYPEMGQGSHSYHSNYGYHSVNFGQQTYNYNVMPYTLSKPCNEAAKLIYHCGISVDMSYDAEGSGAQTEDTRNALRDYYKYDNEIANASRDGGGWGGWGQNGYTDEQWIDLLKGNFDQGYPIIYSGYTDDWAGHAFLCDGYDDADLFHFNWGWGGSGNGFFTINNLNSGNGTFNTGHRIVYNIHPPTNIYPPYCQDIVINATAGSLEDGSGHLDYQNNTNCTYIIAPTNGKSVTLTVAELDIEENADFLRIYDGNPNNGGNLLHEYTGNSFNPSESIYSTTGVAYITFTTNGSVTRPGWKLRFTAKRYTQCNSNTTLTEPSGTFTDGSEDEEYASDASCSWIIAPNEASWVRIVFPEFDISSEDKVNVYKGTSTSNLVLLGTYSNALTPPSYITNTTGGVIKVEFRSDCYIQRDGFRVEWTSDGIESPDAISEHSALDFEAFPNPANNAVELIVPKDFTNGNVRITDMTGRTVLNQEISTIDGRAHISTTNLQSGIYLITLYNTREISSKKLIIKH